MDLPNYPEDPELKNIIDKLAQFVARNGIDFERITREKNRDNPKFEFLSGGAYYNYYSFMLNKERAILRQKSVEQQLNLNSINSIGPPQIHPPIFAQQQAIGQNPMSQFNNPVHPHANQSAPSQAFAAALAATQQKARSQINELQDQIRQSLDNLNAQHQMLTNQQQMLIDESIRKIQVDELVKLANDYNINLNEFELLLHPIFETCTKDSISAGKAWISTRCHLPVHHEIICKYFLKRIRSPGMPDIHKLHLLYLINDLFNHCARKNIDSLKQALTSVIIPIYCLTYIDSDEDTRQKLMKLEKIWNQYLDRSIIEQLRNPQISLSNYQQALCSEYSNLLAPITAGTMAKFGQLQQQHNDFVNHQNSKIQQIQVSTSLPPTSLSMSAVNSSSVSQGPFLSSTHSPFNQPPVSSVLPMLQQNQMLKPPTAALPPAIPSSSISPNVGHSLSQHLAFVQSQSQNIPPLQPNPHMFNNNANQMPPAAAPGHHHLIQHPPPQIPPAIVQNVDHANLPPPNNQPQFTQPDVPYYELPAGLMVPLVKLEDFDYEEINPNDIKLPLPAPPNERLLRAVEEFYAPPSHDKPRNQDGWTQLGLYEFYRAKTQAKKEKDEMEEMERQNKKVNRDGFSIENKSRSKSSSPGRIKYSSGSSRRSSRSNSKQSSKHSSSRRSRQKRHKRSYSSSSSSSTDSSDFYSNKKYSSESRSRSRSSSRGRSYKSSRSSKRYRSHSRSNSPRNRSSDGSTGLKFSDFKRHK